MKTSTKKRKVVRVKEKAQALIVGRKIARISPIDVYNPHERGARPGPMAIYPLVGVSFNRDLMREAKAKIVPVTITYSLPLKKAKRT